MTINWRREPWPDWRPTHKWRGSAFARRRMFFEQHPEHCNGHVVCPACGYPTLMQRGSFDNCPLCHWEDDGHDDPQAHYRNGGPNDSTLNKARENFEQTCSVWSINEKDEFTPWNQVQLFDVGVIQQKRAWRACYDELLTLEAAEFIAQCWNKIEQQIQENKLLCRSLVEKAQQKKDRSQKKHTV